MFTPRRIFSICTKGSICAVKLPTTGQATRAASARNRENEFICLPAQFLSLETRRLTWRTHSCVPCRDSSRHLRGKPGVGTSADAARTCARATPPIARQVPSPTVEWAGLFPSPQLSSREQFSSRSEEHTSELQSLRHLVCRL